MLVPGILQITDCARELLHLPSGPAQSGPTRRRSAADPARPRTLVADGGRAERSGPHALFRRSARARV